MSAEVFGHLVAMDSATIATYSAETDTISTAGAKGTDVAIGTGVVFRGN